MQATDVYGKTVTVGDQVWYSGHKYEVRRIEERTSTLADSAFILTLLGKRGRVMLMPAHNTAKVEA
jgi:hypothetical protein